MTAEVLMEALRFFVEFPQARGVGDEVKMDRGALRLLSFRREAPLDLGSGAVGTRHPKSAVVITNGYAGTSKRWFGWGRRPRDGMAHIRMDAQIAPIRRLHHRRWALFSEVTAAGRPLKMVQMQGAAAPRRG